MILETLLLPAIFARSLEDGPKIYHQGCFLNGGFSTSSFLLIKDLVGKADEYL